MLRGSERRHWNLARKFLIPHRTIIHNTERKTQIILLEASIIRLWIWHYGNFRMSRRRCRKILHESFVSVGIIKVITVVVLRWWPIGRRIDRNDDRAFTTEAVWRWRRERTSRNDGRIRWMNDLGRRCRAAAFLVCFCQIDDAGVTVFRGVCKSKSITLTNSIMPK